MKVKGLGPIDKRSFYLSTSEPGTSDNRTLTLLKGNSYKITMKWVSSILPGWYCWEARLDDPPKPNQHTFFNYNKIRLPGAETITGKGYFVDNADGLLTCHIHQNDDVNLPGSRSATLYVPKLKIDVTSPKQGASVNPPPFDGGKVHDFNSSKSFNPGKHLVVFYKDVVNSDFSIQDFNVKFKPIFTPAAPEWILSTLNPRWAKLDGPASGALDSTTGLEVNYQNPKEGGVYNFAFDLDGFDTTQFNVVLPFAGAEMDDVIKADLLKADAFATSVKAIYTPKELQQIGNW
ncbi:MAG: hypothetical protein FWG05_02875, partial [Kiritimatiellaeota bacterium]|nr:hypothetical protein [Kiritimatiellota bacterium]